MSERNDKRLEKRYKIPLSTLMPEISKAPLDVSDISAGGFQVVLPQEPRTDAPLEGTLYRSGKLIGRFLARVVWKVENASQPPSWTIGVSMDVHGGDKRRLSEELQAAIHQVTG